MRGFRRVRGAYVAELEPQEREVVASVVADVAELLGAGRFEDRDPSAGDVTGPGDPLGLRLTDQWVAPPQDAAVRRLLPDASRDDPAVAAEFRRLTEDDLRRVKVERLAALWHQLTAPAARGSGDTLTVPPETAPDLAATLTDLRLVLAERLGLVDDEASEALYDGLEVDSDDEDPATHARHYLGSVYAALSWLQESLLAVMLADLGRAR
jgi:hypothetical protein